MRNKTKILYLANSGEIIGGGQISLLGLLKGLSPKKFSPYVVCPSKGNFVNKLKNADIDPHIIKMDTLRNGNIFLWVKTIKKLIGIISEKKIDIIHSNGSRPTIYGGIAAKIMRVPIIWHVRIADRDKWLDKILALLATKILVVSKSVSERFKWIEYKISIVYNGIDLDKFNTLIDGSIIRREFSISADTPLVGIVGRLDNYKGHQYFLKAAKSVINETPDTNFIVVGDGENRKKLEYLVRELDLAGNVIFTGNREDIAEIMAALDLFVLSSVSEGFGRSAVEAMACGKAVVASNVGGLPEIVKDGITGKLVQPRNSEALAKTIISLLKDTEKARKMGMAGRKRAEKYFSIQKNIRKTIAIYQEICPNTK